MGNTGQGYDVCSVFNLCLLAPPSPKIQPLLKMSQPLTISHSNSTNACSHNLLTFLLLFLSFSFPHFNTDFLLCCSTSCRETSSPLSGVQGPEHGEVSMKTTSNISCKFKNIFVYSHLGKTILVSNITEATQI